MQMPRILVFQHCPPEHLGRFAPLFAARGIAPVTVELDQGGQIPDLAGFDGLWVLGGPQQVWQEDDHPWLRAEKAAIREAVQERGMAFMGLCLGHQLLAEATGGRVGPSATPEVGILSVELTKAGRGAALFAGLSPVMSCVQGHGAEVAELPEGAVSLAKSPSCGVQAIQVGDRAFGVQFHMELTPDMIDACLELPEYKADFDAMLGPEGVAAFLAANRAQAGMFDADAKRLFDNWMALSFGL